jgi:hypothetical protein
LKYQNNFADLAGVEGLRTYNEINGRDHFGHPKQAQETQ